MRSWVVFVYTLFISLTVQSQMRLDFKASNAFVLKVNGHPMNIYPVHRLGFDWETNEKKFQLVTLLSNGDSVVQSLVYKNGFSQDFELQQIKNVWKWQVVGENTWQPNEWDSSAVVSLDPVYHGLKNCQAPMDADQWGVFLKEVQSATMTTQKLKIISMLSKGACCTVEQWMMIFTDIELEDDKLSLLNIIKGSIYDWDHRMELSGLFLIERNRNKAIQLLSQ